MKRLSNLIIALACSAQVFAGPAFSGKIEDLSGKNVAFYDIQSMYDSYKAYAYTIAGGKLKIVKDPAFYASWSKDEACKIVDIPEIGGKKLIEVERAGQTVYLKYIEGHKYQVKSLSCIADVLATYNAGKVYMLKGLADDIASCTPVKDFAAYQNGCFCKRWVSCQWTEYSLPANYSGDVKFTIKAGDVTITLSETDVEKYAAAFVSETEYQSRKAAFLEARAREEARMAALDTVEHKVAQWRGTDGHYAEGPIYLYSAVKAEDGSWNYKAFSGMKELVVDAYRLSLTTDREKASADFLQKRGSTGEKTRMEIAKLADSLYTSASLEASRAESEFDKTVLSKIQSYCAPRGIFVASCSYGFGTGKEIDYELDIYNCFGKAIKYVEMTITAEDSLGVSLSNQAVRCNGPISPKAISNYEFHRVFSLDHASVADVFISYAVIKFEDGSSVKYTSKSGVQSHILTSDRLHYAGLTDDEAQYWTGQL